MGDHSHSIERVLRQFEMLVTDENTEHIKARNSKGEFQYIPLGLSQFYEQLQAATSLWHGDRMPHFVDVGCGIGTKLIAAWGTPRVGAVTGIEIDPKYVRVAQKLIAASDGRYKQIPDKSVNVIQRDALEVNYKPYDIIYFYCPLLDNSKQIELEQRILATAKRGTLVMRNLSKMADVEWAKYAAPVWKDTIWRVK